LETLFMDPCDGANAVRRIEFCRNWKPEILVRMDQGIGMQEL